METEPKGFLHTKLDVKVLILFILARIDTPLSAQEIYEVAYQDESLNYFTFAESLPELVESGHRTNIQLQKRDASRVLMLRTLSLYLWFKRFLPQSRINLHNCAATTLSLQA